jgi:hypothetical protein
MPGYSLHRFCVPVAPAGDLRCQGYIPPDSRMPGNFSTLADLKAIG